MNELFYNIKLTFWFIIVMSFVAFWNIKLDYMTNMQTIWFLSLNRDFEISIAPVNYESKDGTMLYIFKNNTPRDHSNDCLTNTDIPPKCTTKESRRSIKCLRILKEKWYWYVNWLYFVPSDKNCLSTKNNNSYN